MRASPACQVSLRRFGVWHAAIVGLMLVAVAVIATWAVQSRATVAVGSIAFWSIASLVCMAAAASLARTPRADLRWDGRSWHLDAEPGALQVAIDVGSWMLLRFSAMDGRRARWLPVQRAGLEAQWHALRCAVYSPAQPAPHRAL